MLDTPKEKLEHLFDEFIWSWYNTCLPSDLNKMPKMNVPYEIRILLISPMIVELIFTRWDEGLQDRLYGIDFLTKLVNEIDKKSQNKYSDFSKFERLELYGVMRKARYCIKEHNQRMKQLPDTKQKLRRKIISQLPWMFATFTHSERAMITEIAAWYCESIK
jgi:hypothetical protein